MKMLRIQNLAALYTGEGFLRKQGRRPCVEDTGFRLGPMDIVCDSTTGRIVDVAPTRNAPHAGIDSNLDGTGLVATAGLVDSHTHALHAGSRTDEYFRRWAGASYQEIAADGGGIHKTVAATAAAPDDELETTLVERLTTMLHSGATVIEVKSGYADNPADELRLLRIVQRVRHRPRAPMIRSTFLGLHAIPKGANESDYCDNIIMSLDVVRRELLAEFVDTFPEPGFVSLDAALRFSRAAMEMGLRVKVHADQLTANGAADQFVRAGAVSVDHLEMLAEKDVQIVAQSPTVATLLPAAAFFLGSDYPQARQLLDAGARIALASDFNPGSAPRSTLQLTILLAAAQMKMTAAEILCALTVNGAAALALEELHGTLLTGARADILLWRIPSAATVTACSGLEEIFLSGKRPAQVISGGRLVLRQ